MSACAQSIKIIRETECLSESVNTINSNFEALSGIACSLKERVESIRMARTFYYYGPNSDILSYVEENNQIPSDFTISTFVNSPDELNLPLISYPGDTVYIIYQRTGYQVLVDDVVIPTIDGGITFLGSSSLFSNNVRARRDRFFTASQFIRYQTNQNQTTTNSTRQLFTYQRIDQNGRTLNTPNYTPREIFNSSNNRVNYTVRWAVTNTGSANMPAGEYSFSFTLNPKEVTSLSNKIQTWLINRIGHHDVNITGTIIASGETSFRQITNQSRSSQQFIAPATTIPSSIGAATTTETNLRIEPVFYTWKLTYENRPGRGLNYYINNGWPKVHKAETSNQAGLNWNRPQNWGTYNSW